MSRAALLALALALAGNGAVAAPLGDGRVVMGTVLEIELEAVEPAAGRELLERLFARAVELEQLFTRFDPRSALSELNRAAGTARPVPPDLARLLLRSQAWSQRTRGAFDVTVGPLVELWTRAAERGQPPTEAELARARTAVGAAKLRVDPGLGTAALPPGASVDLGGIAKGYALDQLVKLLREERVPFALLSFGGSSVHALGAPPGTQGWRVAVRDAQDRIGPVLALRDLALSVSASLGQTLEIRGQRYGHVIDPRSGRPLTSARLAAVVAPAGVDAEALSKALLVLEIDDALELAGSIPGVEAWTSAAEGSERETRGFARLRASRPDPPPAPYSARRTTTTEVMEMQ